MINFIIPNYHVFFLFLMTYKHEIDKNVFFFVAAELLTSVVYQKYMPTEIQLRYKKSIFALC